jgi:hypothetical protein
VAAAPVNPHWLRDSEIRPAVGGVYLALLLPAAMGLFAQVGGSGTTTVWRISFTGIAVVGLVTTLRAGAAAQPPLGHR